MQNNAFTPFGPTYAVDTSAEVKCVATNGTRCTAYRIHNTTAATAYIGTSPVSGGCVVTAPVVGTPQGGTNGNQVLSMIAGSVEVFCLPPNCYFKASPDGTFFVTPGEGV